MIISVVVVRQQVLLQVQLEPVWIVDLKITVKLAMQMEPVPSVTMVLPSIWLTLHALPVL